MEDLHPLGEEEDPLLRLGVLVSVVGVVVRVLGEDRITLEKRV